MEWSKVLKTKLRHLPSAPHSHHLGGADGDVPHSTVAGGSKIDNVFPVQAWHMLVHFGTETGTEG